MRRKKTTEEFSEASSANGLVTNFKNMVKLEPERNNAGFLDFCITRLYEMHGQSKRFIMCRLMMQGLETDPLYSQEMGRLKDEFESLTNNR